MADAPDFQVYLPIDPSVPLLISLQAALHMYEGMPEYGKMQVIMKGEAAEGENILELEIADAQNVDEKGAPTPIWDFIIVLRYGIPSRHKITNGPNRGKIAEESGHWWAYAMKFVQATQAFLKKAHPTVEIERTFPVSSGIVEDSFRESLSYEYRVPIKAWYRGEAAS